MWRRTAFSARGRKRPLEGLAARVESSVPVAGLTLPLLGEGASVKFRAERIEGENTLVAIRAVPPCVRFQFCD